MQGKNKTKNGVEKMELELELVSLADTMEEFLEK